MSPGLRSLPLLLLLWGTASAAGGCDPGPAAGTPAAATPPGSPTADPVDPLEARRKALSEEMRELVDDLEHAGRYDCCTETPCKQCAFRTGGCRCGAGLRNGEPVCEECAMMWQMGKGAEAVDPGTVRSFLEAQREERQRAEHGADAPACACGEHGGGAKSP